MLERLIARVGRALGEALHKDGEDRVSSPGASREASFYELSLPERKRFLQLVEWMTWEELKVRHPVEFHRWRGLPTRTPLERTAKSNSLLRIAGWLRNKGIMTPREDLHRRAIEIIRQSWDRRFEAPVASWEEAGVKEFIEEISKKFEDDDVRVSK